MKKILLLSLVFLIGLSGCWPFGNSTPLSKNDYRDTYALIDDYQEAIILYSAITATSTKTVEFADWQNWVIQNSNQWEQLDSDSASLMAFENPNRAYAADNTFATSSLSGFPIEFEDRLFDGIKNDAQNFGIQVDAFKNIDSSEYKEVAVTADLKTYTNPQPSILSRISGYSLPLPSADSVTNFLINGSFKLTDKLLGTNFSNYVGIDGAILVIYDDGTNIEINSNYRPKSFDVADAKQLADKAILASKDIISKKGWLYVVDRTFSRPEQLVIDTVVNYSTQSNLQDRPLSLSYQSGELKVNENKIDETQLIRDYGLNNTLPAIFPSGEFVIDGNVVKNNSSSQSNNSNTSSNESDLKTKNYTGSYVTTFTTESMGIVSNTTITFTIDANDQITANLTMDAPTTNYSYGGVSGSITSSGSASFGGVYDTKNNFFEIKSDMTTNSTTTVGGATDSASFSDNVTLSGSLNDGMINGTASSATFGSIEFTAVKQ